MIRPTRVCAMPLFLGALLAASLPSAPARADVRLPHVIGDNMVLQRDVELPIWGWADVGEQVTVTLGGQKETVTADDGIWIVRLPAMRAGGPHELAVEGKNRLTVKNILVGEVWVCSGQSNMEWSVARSENPQEEIAAAKYPKIRLFHIPKLASAKPLDDVDAQWKECNPETIANFSAVAYFFGRTLHKQLDVPVGLINTSWGGTRIEPWTPVEGFRAVENTQVRAIADEVERRSADEKVNQQAPTGLFNGMVYGIVPFALRGAIWYQGESNRGEGMLYYEKMKALIAGWRSVWAEGDFPFYYVQLAPYQYDGNREVLAKLWEAQTETLRVKNTGMAVTTDIGDLKDIHPRNKQEVGRRLALWALAKTYGKKDVVFSGPMLKTATFEGGKARLSFDYVGAGIKSSDGGPLRWFSIAGEDGQFVPAQAEIDGQTVVVSSDKVKEPSAVRYGWHDHEASNFVNEAGLPAVPFRTDR